MTVSHGLSKTRFVQGQQCHKLLWRAVHEPDAEEFQHDAAEQARFDQGRLVGAEARKRFPGGEFIDLPYRDPEAIPATRRALEKAVPAIFEASFLEGGVFAAVDVLLRDGAGFTVIEVKSSSKLKPEHVVDAAIQTWVVRRAGLNVQRVEIMHLNKNHRHPDVEDLFVRVDVTEKVESILPTVPAAVQAQLAALRGPLPNVPVGPHCKTPRECPFFESKTTRGCCGADLGHVRELYYGGQLTWQLLARGVTRIVDIPEDVKLDPTQARQRRALEAGGRVVDPRLAAELGALSGRIGYLDFETVQRALPWLPGLGPWAQVPVQFSYDEQQADGTLKHEEWLAKGSADPRQPLANELLRFTAAANVVVVYGDFERQRIGELATLLPHLSKGLRALQGKLLDLERVVERSIYHPAFGGSFSVKAVLTPMVPELSYEDLEIREGGKAAATLWTLLTTGDQMDPAEREKVRGHLLRYCHRDTEAMVKLVARLRELARAT